MPREATAQELQALQESGFTGDDTIQAGVQKTQGAPPPPATPEQQPPDNFFENLSNAFRNEASLNTADYPVNPNNPGTYIGGMAGGMAPVAGGALAGAGLGFVTGGPPGAIAGGLYGGITGAGAGGVGRAVDRQMDAGKALQEINPIPPLVEGIGEGALQALAPGVGSIWRRLAINAAKQGIGTGVLSTAVQAAEAGQVDAQRVLMDAAAGAGAGAIGGAIFNSGKTPLTKAVGTAGEGVVQPKPRVVDDTSAVFQNDLAVWRNMVQTDPQKAQILREAIKHQYGVDPSQHVLQGYISSQADPTETIGQWRVRNKNAPRDLMNPDVPAALQISEQLRNVETGGRKTYAAGVNQAAEVAKQDIGKFNDAEATARGTMERGVRVAVDATISKKRQEEITAALDTAAKAAAEAEQKLQNSLEQGEFDTDAAKAWLEQKTDQNASLARIVDNISTWLQDTPPTDEERAIADKLVKAVAKPRKRKAAEGKMVTLDSLIPNAAERLARTAEAARKFSLSMVSDQFEGATLLARSLYMHTSNRLPEELGDLIHAGASRKAYFVYDHVIPVIKAAKEAGYVPELDDAWIAKLFKTERLIDVVEGKVDFQTYMKDRASPETVNFTQRWATARLAAPKEAGLKIRDRYDELRRAYFYDRIDQGILNLGDSRHKDGEYLTIRQMFERDLDSDIDTADAINVTSDYPLLSVFLKDMEMMANQVAFNPIAGVGPNGYKFHENSIARQLFNLASNVAAPKDQRQAAADTLKLINGTYQFGKVVPQILANFSDGVLTQNLGSAVSNYASLYAITDVPMTTITKAVGLLKSDPVARQLVRKAGLQDHISFLKDLVNAKKIKFEDASGDLYRMSEEHVRGIVYLAKTLHQLEKNPKYTLQDLVDGKGDSHKILGQALKEIQNTQGTAHNLSIRSGKVIAPGSFLLQNARVSEMGRTLAQARMATQTGNFKPLLRNIAIRAAIGGGRMIIDPATARLLIPAVAAAPIADPELRTSITQQLNAIATNGEPAPVLFMPELQPVVGYRGVLGVVDNVLNTDMSSKFSMISADIPILSDVFKGTVKPVDMQYAANYANQAFDPDAPASVQQNAAGAIIKKLTPLLGSFKVGGVRLSPHLIFKGIEASEDLHRYHEGQADVVMNTAVSYNDAQILLSPFMSGNLQHQKVFSMQADKQQLRKLIREQSPGTYTGESDVPGELSPRTWKLIDHYLHQYGDIDPSVKAAADQEQALIDAAMVYSPGRTERFLDVQMKEAVSREYRGDEEGAGKLYEFVRNEADRYNKNRSLTRRGYDVDKEQQDVIKQGL